MKKNRIFAAIVFAASLSATASYATAQTAVNQNAVNQSALANQASVVTVKEALASKDDTKVMLRGQVFKSLGNEKYQFRDSTGDMIVEIDDKLWQGRPVSSAQTVTLFGEVDIDHKPSRHIEIDVDRIQF